MNPNTRADAKAPTNERDPQWLDRMYNNRALVPDHADFFRRWAESSALARQSEPCITNLAYGADAMETLDVFPAASGLGKGVSGAPVLVFIHGGYWRSLDKSDHSFIAPAFTRAGACVVVLNYALCPAVTIPQICEQTIRALIWTWRNIAAHGGDPHRISVVGHSAGGHLAAMLMACDWQQRSADLPARLVSNALSISGLYDLEPLRHTPFLQASLQITPEHVQAASPVLLTPPRHGQLLALAGGDESGEFLRQNQLIQEVWGTHSVPICETCDGLNHFSVLDALAQPRHRLHQLALGLLGLDSSKAAA